MRTAVARLTIWHLEIPLRKPFGHAAASRAVAEPLVVAVELSDGTIGYGETHPRDYVTGETLDSALAAIRDEFLPRLTETAPDSLVAAFEFLDTLPLVADGGKPLTAARSAVELALLDAWGRSIGHSLETVAGWLGLVGGGPPGSLPRVRYSGVIGGDDAGQVARSILKMRCYGLRDFKLKVGDAGDDDRVRAAVRQLGGSLKGGRATLRLDANGAWSLDGARERLARWQDLPIVSVEQPLARGAERELPALAAAVRLPLMADESLVTAEDAEDLIVRRAVKWFNIRLSKNGGLVPAMRLAATARRHGIECQLGCMVGETSILSAAGRWFLQLVPGIRFAEGSYGPFLLRGDVVRRPLRFGYGGRGKPLAMPGWGIEVDAALLARWCPRGPIRLPL